MAPAQMMERLTSLEEEQAALREENAALRAQVEWFKRNWLGTGKSETQDALQTRLDIDDKKEEIPEKTTKVSYERKAKKSPRELPTAWLVGRMRGASSSRPSGRHPGRCAWCCD
jgi:hypothetical protein